MNTDPMKFEITVNGVIYNVERSPSDVNIYRLSSPLGRYLIARDFFGVWVELTSKKGSASISLSQIGQQIEDHDISVNSV